MLKTIQNFPPHREVVDVLLAFINQEYAKFGSPATIRVAMADNGKGVSVDGWDPATENIWHHFVTFEVTNELTVTALPSGVCGNVEPGEEDWNRLGAFEDAKPKIQEWVGQIFHGAQPAH